MLHIVAHPKRLILKISEAAILASCLLLSAAQAQSVTDEIHHSMPSPAEMHGEMPHGDHHGDMRHEGMPGEMAPALPFLHGLNLTEEQQDKIFWVMHNQEPVMRNLMKASHKNREALHQLGLTTPLDEAKVKAVIDMDLKTISEITILHLRTEQQIIGLLTPEQRKKMEMHQ